MEDQPLLDRASPAHEAAQLLRSSLGAGRIILEVGVFAVLVHILFDPNVRAAAPILILPLGVFLLYYVVQRCSPRIAAYVIPYGQAAAGACLVVAAAALPPTVHVLPALLESEQRVPSDPIRCIGWLVGGIHMGCQAVPLRTKLGCEGTVSVLYAVGLLMCAYRTGVAASKAYPPIAAEAILHGLGLCVALCLQKTVKCAPVIANLESMASDVQQSQERLAWDLKLKAHALQQATHENDRLAAAIERSFGTLDELSSKVSSDMSSGMQATVEADAHRRGLYNFPYHSPSSSEGSHHTAKLGGLDPGA